MVRRELHIIGRNRAYYAIFHAIHALDGNGYKLHKDIIANFDKQYIKTEIFPRKIGRKISKAEEIRHASDYDDFYIASKSEADNLISIANEFIKTVCKRKIMNILIIEDDAAIRQELKLLLENALYQVTVLTEFHHVVEDILQIEPDLLLLDVHLPQQSGFEICKSIRKTSDVPTIFLTSRTDSMDELSGMLQGGDAYITKPFQPPLLLAHIAAVLKRAKKADIPEKMTCKGVELDVVRGCVKYQGQQVDLSKNELKILHYLFLHQGEIVPRIELVEYLWDQQVFIDDNALSVNITRLRAKLAEIGVCDFIETKRGMGYRI